MGRAVVLSTASKHTLTGGSFADTLTANSGDSLSVANFNTGGAKIIEAWGSSSDAVFEGELIYTRPEATHDQQHGLRFEIASITPGGANKVGAQTILGGLVTVDLFKSDVGAITVTGTASDDVAVCLQTLYDDLPGVQGVFASWDQVQALQKSVVGIQVTAVASATQGAYGAQRAFNADDDRLHANTWYAILGCSVQTPVTVISLIGPDWGGQRIGMPMGALNLFSTSWFVDQTIKWGVPLIPCFNSNNKGNVLVQIADTEASTSPKIDFLLYELTSQPGF